MPDVRDPRVRSRMDMDAAGVYDAVVGIHTGPGPEDDVQVLPFGETEHRAGKAFLVVRVDVRVHIPVQDMDGLVPVRIAEQAAETVRDDQGLDPVIAELVDREGLRRFLHRLARLGRILAGFFPSPAAAVMGFFPVELRFLLKHLHV